MISIFTAILILSSFILLMLSFGTREDDLELSYNLLVISYLLSTLSFMIFIIVNITC